ncbi:GNAT family N-acetyltransferase [Sabulilitoribacter arenilitoris]|uniref:GNAT family N-acetyltransferase n=1 Tax=Wocania arenilitoris TaxID=2044858 RepID=A0AAE3ESF8_9FLAO|nr:GNAT family N-acetyltransferase [Wocania arenilitoris]MCF7569399.1 GNAT family N-acetyltransferase [Wocania arenilitoris]
MIEITPANKTSDFLLIEELANLIWREHYIPIVGKPQIDYMLDKFQSANAISKQIEEEGFEYYILTFNKTPVGYIGFKKEKEHLFLSKIYVLSKFRGKKIGKTAMEFITEKAKSYRLKAIRLGVNINNTNSIIAYEKLGFKKIFTFVTDIGNGFVMDDYIMEKKV